MPWLDIELIYCIMQFFFTLTRVLVLEDRHVDSPIRTEDEIVDVVSHVVGPCTSGSGAAHSNSIRRMVCDSVTKHTLLTL